METMGQNEAAQFRNRHDIAVRLGLFVWDGEQIEFDVAMRIPDRLDRRQLRRLMFECVEAMGVAKQELKGHEHGQQPQRHRQHGARFFDEASLPQIRGRDADNDEAGGDIDRVDDMSEPVGEGWAEDDLQPVLRQETAVDDFITGGRLHPAVGGDDPEGRKERPEGDHQRRDEMGPGRHQLASEQQHAEESRLQEESGQPLVGQQRPDNVGGGVGVTAPVRADLERHDDPRNDAHAE